LKSERKGMSFNKAEGLHHEDHYHLRHSTSHEVPRDDDDEEEGGSHREDLSILIRKAVREERKRDKFRERKRLSCQVVFVLLVVCAVALAGFLLTMPEYFAWVAESYRGNARAAVDQGDPRARGQWREVYEKW